MDRREFMIDRTAQALMRGGYDNLSDSELIALKRDEEYAKSVSIQKEKYERNKVLNPQDPYRLYEKVDRVFSKQFSFGDWLFEVFVYKDVESRNLLLEMKHWSKYGLTIESGFHEVLLRTSLDSVNIDEIKQKCKEKLLNSGYSTFEVDTEISTWSLKQ